MPNDSRNNWEVPCYLDLATKLFPESPAGQGLDLTDPNTRDQAFTKNIIREGLQEGFKPVKVWLYSHQDALGNQPGGGPVGAGGPMNDPEDFYGDGGGGRLLNEQPGRDTGTNFYNEAPTKVFSGPFIIRGEYIPVEAEIVLLDFALERTYNDVFNFLIDDCMRILGRKPWNGDLIQRFDGKILEIVKSYETNAQSWEWLYQTCPCINTGKDDEAFFRGKS